MSAMSMFDHVGLKVRDLARSVRFYRAALAVEAVCHGGAQG